MIGRLGGIAAALWPERRGAPSAQDGFLGRGSRERRWSHGRRERPSATRLRIGERWRWIHHVERPNHGDRVTTTAVHAGPLRTDHFALMQRHRQNFSVESGVNDLARALRQLRARRHSLQTQTQDAADSLVFTLEEFDVSWHLAAQIPLNSPLEVVDSATIRRLNQKRNRLPSQRDRERLCQRVGTLIAISCSFRGP